MDALTPEARAELNAWIAEHVYQLQVRWDSEFVDGPVVYDEDTNSWFMVDDYAGDWFYAGRLFDRYPGFILMHNGYYFACTFGTQSTRGTTGPEAIAKAVKVYEEEQRT